MSMFELISCVELGIIFGLVAVGIYLTFKIIEFPDLTCDGSFVLGAATAGMLIKSGVNPILALVFAALSGAIAGACTWALHVYFKISNILAGIMMAFMLYSINLRIMQGMPNIVLLDLGTIFSNGNSLVILCGIGLACCAIVGFVLVTDFGLAMRCVGQNPRLAQNCGIAISTMTLVALVLSNGLIALSGALFSQQQGFTDLSQGVGTIIVALAAVVIGEKLLPTRNMWLTIFSCILGSIVYRILIAGALHSEWLGLQTQDLNLITGVLVIAIMVLPSLKRRVNHATT